MRTSTIWQCAKLSDIRKLSSRIHYQKYAEEQR